LPALLALALGYRGTRQFLTQTPPAIGGKSGEDLASSPDGQGLIDVVNEGFGSPAQHNSATLHHAAQQAGQPDGGLAFGQQTPFPSVGNTGNADLPAILRGAVTRPDAEAASDALPSWLATAIRTPRVGAFGASSPQPQGPSGSSISVPLELGEAQRINSDSSLSRRVRTLADGRYFQDDSTAEDAGGEGKKPAVEQEDSQNKEQDDDDQNDQLPRFKGPKLEPGLRPGNPGGNSARPKRLDQCVRAAEGDQDEWAAFCRTVPRRKNVINKVAGGGSARLACENKIPESNQNRSNWCQNQFDPDSRKGQGPTLSSSAFNSLRNPPQTRSLRPFEADYPDLDDDASGSPLKLDIDGRPRIHSPTWLGAEQLVDLMNRYQPKRLNGGSGDFMRTLHLPTEIFGTICNMTIHGFSTLIRTRGVNDA